MHQSWRSAIEWKKSGLEMSTVSDTACKLYDAAITQYVGWYEDDTLGGIEKTIQDLRSADPNFVMGHVLSTGLDLIGTGRSPRLDPAFQKEIDEMLKLATNSSQSVTERELDHVSALKLFSQGEMLAAANTWENILNEYPTDMLALKFAHDTYFYLGLQTQLRDSVAGVFPKWKTTEPLYSYLHGMYSFGLVETNFYRQAETMALKGLELNSKDGWSTHGLAHVYEMEGKANEGVTFMTRTMKDWESCGLLACHNYWHLALYFIEKMEYDSALQIFDDQLSKRASSGALLDIVDGASLLYRLEMEGVNVKNRWNRLNEICQPHLKDHILLFNDMHLFMVCLGAGDEKASDIILNTMKDYIEIENGTNKNVCSEIGVPVLNALAAAKEKRYSDVVKILYPLRYSLVKMGGSNAQRDVLNILLIISAFKSTEPSHKALAKRLLFERQALKSKCSLQERIQQQSASYF